MFAYIFIFRGPRYDCSKFYDTRSDNVYHYVFESLKMSLDLGGGKQPCVDSR